MTDRISEIKSLLETLSLKLAYELQSQREEIEELRKRVAELEGQVAAEPKIVVVERPAEVEPEPVEVPEDSAVISDVHQGDYEAPKIDTSSPVETSEEDLFTVTDLKDIHNAPRVTVSDMFATTNTIADVARSKARPWMVDIPGPKVEMIQSALTFNDRLTFIRDLFEGDSEQFNITLDRINETSTFDEVVSDMRDAYPEWDEDSDLVYRFYMEVRRRFRD